MSIAELKRMKSKTVVIPKVLSKEERAYSPDTISQWLNYTARHLVGSLDHVDWLPMPRSIDGEELFLESDLISWYREAGLHHEIRTNSPRPQDDRYELHGGKIVRIW